MYINRRVLIPSLKRAIYQQRNIFVTCHCLRDNLLKTYSDSLLREIIRSSQSLILSKKKAESIWKKTDSNSRHLLRGLTSKVHAMISIVRDLGEFYRLERRILCDNCLLNQNFLCFRSFYILFAGCL